MTLSVNHYGSNYIQRLGKESSSTPQDAVVQDRLSKQSTEDKEELVHIAPTFRHTRTASALAKGGWATGIIGVVSCIPLIIKPVRDSLPKGYISGAIGVTAVAGLLGGALGYFESKGPVREAKYEYEMEHDVDLISVPGTVDYKAVPNDHKVKKVVEALTGLTILK
ncbi:MAG: hypothetical protein ACK5T0_04385 [Vampirovibrionales bacterium]|jgi:hypothetical protein